MNFRFIENHEGRLYVIRIIGQQLYVLLRELCGFIPPAANARQRFLRFKVNVGHWLCTNCHDGEYAGCRSLPSSTFLFACLVKSLAVSEDWNMRLNLGMGAKYHNLCRNPFPINHN